MFRLVINLFFLVVISPFFSWATPVKVGVSVPLTGAPSTYGTDIKNVLMFLNERESPKPFQFIIENDKCSPKEAVKVAHILL